MIELQQLSKRFGNTEVVKGLTFDVAEGTVLGFLGPNGAGKSTTMKMITGFLEPSAGCARIYGHDVVAERQSAQSMLGYLPEGAPSYEDMTPQSFLRFIAEIRGFKGRNGTIGWQPSQKSFLSIMYFINASRRCLKDLSAG